METNKKTIFNIPLSNFGYFHHRIKKLNRRANKIGTKPMNYKKIGEIYNDIKDHTGKVIGQKLFGYQVTVSGEIPKYENSEFIATIEHTDAGNIIRALENHPAGMLEPYRTVKTKCDHCKHNRMRKKTYLVRKDGEIKQVGSSCLKDFIGHAGPEWIAQISEVLKLLNDAEHDESFGSSYTGPPLIARDDYLLNVARAYNRIGWMSKAEANQKEQTSTAILAWQFIFPPKDPKTGEILIEIPPITNKDRELKKELVKWIEDLQQREKGLNDFLWNVRIATSQEFIEHKHTGLVAASLIAMQKEKERELIRAKKKATWNEKAQASKFFGEPKERYELEVTVTNRRSIPGRFTEWTDIVTMEDEKGHVFVWMTGKNTTETLPRNAKVKIKATIKGHSEYRGLKQTRVTRVKVTETLKNAS